MRRLWIVLAVVLLAAAIAGSVSAAARRPQPPRTTKATVVKVTLKEWTVKASPAKAKAGTVRFTVTNSGTRTHALAIEGTKSVTNDVAPGKKATLTAQLKPGKYTLFCPLDGHRALGMHTQVTITK